MYPYDKHKHTQSLTQASKTMESGHCKGAQSSSFFSGNRLRGLGDFTEPVGSGDSTEIEFSIPKSPVLLSFLCMLCHLHLPPKDAPFLIILFEKYREKVTTVDGHSLQNYHRFSEISN